MNERIRKKLLYFVSVGAMIAILTLIGYAFFMRQVNVDVTQNMKLEYTGENGNASLVVTNPASNINERTRTFLESVKYEADPNTDLSNGDKVTITATYDKSLAHQYNFHPTNTTTTIKVSGLPDQYATVSKIPKSYLQDIYAAADTYIDDHEEDIFRIELNQSNANVKLRSNQTIYRAFLKSKKKGNSDRILEMHNLQYRVNDTDYTIYYTVIVPRINDSKEVVTDDIYGEEATMSEDEIKNKQYSEYVSRVYGSGYTIEEIK